MNYSTMTKEEAIAYCHRHRNKYIGDFDEGDGVRQFDCLIGLLESGTISPAELPAYGMDYEEANNEAA